MRQYGGCITAAPASYPGGASPRKCAASMPCAAGNCFEYSAQFVQNSAQCVQLLVLPQLDTGEPPFTALTASNSNPPCVALYLSYSLPDPKVGGYPEARLRYAGR